MTKKKKSNFGAKVAKNSAKGAGGGAQYGYLKIPEGLKIFSAPGGETVSFDIIPYEVTDKKHMDRDAEEETALVGEEWYRKPIMVHRGVGAENTSVICGKTFKKPCALCKEHAVMSADPNVDDKEADKLKAKLRNLYVIYPRDGELKGQLCLFDMSHYLFQKKLDAEIQADSDNWEFADTEGGLTLKVRFEEKTFNKNKYAETDRIDFKSRKKPIPQSILDKVPKLDDVITLLSDEKMKDILFSDTDDDDDDEEFETSNKKKKGKKADTKEPARKKKSTKADAPSNGKKKTKNPCPFKLEFGVDFNNDDACSDCSEDHKAVHKACKKEYKK